jgi:ribosomal protein S18 acetylase RimI-like enzyme
VKSHRIENSNFERLIRLAEETFDAKNDPDQLNMTDADRAQLARLHPATMSQKADENGPVAWMLIFPTTRALMERFLTGEIGERQLLHETQPGMRYDSVYLCSALVLTEYRGQGIARRLARSALRAITNDHPIKTLFIWPFSSEGDRLASSLAKEFDLPLRRRKARGSTP